MVLDLDFGAILGQQGLESWVCIFMSRRMVVLMNLFVINVDVDEDVDEVF